MAFSKAGWGVAGIALRLWKKEYQIYLSPVLEEGVDAQPCYEFLNLRRDTNLGAQR